VTERASLLDRLTDRAIGLVSPRAVARRKAWRARGRIAEEVARQARFYGRQVLKSARHRGADTNRGRSKWIPGQGSADSDTLDDLPMLRDRSRDLNRSNGYAAGVTGTMTTNVAGTGHTPQSKIDVDGLKAKGVTLSENRIAEAQVAIERGWRKWAHSHVCDSRNRLHFFEIENLVERESLEAGDCFILPLMLDRHGPPPRPYSLALEIVEADRVDTPTDKSTEKTIRSGVALGSRGEPTAYWVMREHPGDSSRYCSGLGKSSSEFNEIPAWGKAGRPNVLHHYHVLRSGQTRGVPLFTPVMEFIRHLAQYMEAEQWAKRMEACIGLIIKSADAFDVASAYSTETDSESKRVQDFEPGMTWYLDPGQELTPFNPQRPGNSFEPFTRLILRAISTGLGLPYELVAKDFSESNYSNMRAALLEARRLFRYRQRVLISHLGQPAWDMLIEEMVLRGEVALPNFYRCREEYTRARWIPCGWQWIDPLKEVQASRLAVEAGLSTHADELAAHGKDVDEVIEENSRVYKVMRERGLPLFVGSGTTVVGAEEETAAGRR
jgi:lambda family phage portal protein